LASIQLEALQFTKGLETLATIECSYKFCVLFIISVEFEEEKSRPVAKGDVQLENFASYLYTKAVLLRNCGKIDEAILYLKVTNNTIFPAHFIEIIRNFSTCCT
jgi:hypothetical protein